MERRKRRQGTKEETWLISYADLITNLLLFFACMLTASNLSTVKQQQIAERLSGKVSSKSLKSIQNDLEKMIQEKKLENLVHTEINDQGLGISLNSGIMFMTGSAQIEKKWLPVLNEVMRSLVPYADQYRFAVEGHTDSLPIVSGSSKFSSNWELSSARAILVRDYLENFDIPANRTRVEGYADTIPLPLDKNRSQDDINAARRRVVIRVY